MSERPPGVDQKGVEIDDDQRFHVSVSETLRGGVLALRTCMIQQYDPFSFDLFPNECKYPLRRIIFPG